MAAGGDRNPLPHLSPTRPSSPQGTLVFVPPLTEQQFFATLRAFLAKRKLGLADLFAALDTDLDGCLGSGSELRALAAHVVPGAAPSEVAYITVSGWPRVAGEAAGEFLFTSPCETNKRQGAARA